MMIYNTIDVPVMVTVGDQTFRLEPESEKELKLSAGEYFFSIYKIDPYTDEPMRKYKTDYYPSTGLDFHRGKWGRHGMMRYDEGYDSTAICYGTSARLTLCRATKLYIRDTYSNSLIFRLSNERYFADLFEFQLEEGEFSFRKDGLPDEQTRTKLLHSIYLQFVGSMLKGLSFIGLLALLAFFGLRYGMKELAAVLTAEPDSLVLIIAPILYIAFVGYDIYKFRHAKEIKNLPLMPTKEEYDYL